MRPTRSDLRRRWGVLSLCWFCPANWLMSINIDGVCGFCGVLQRRASKIRCANPAYIGLAIPQPPRVCKRESVLSWGFYCQTNDPHFLCLQKGKQYFFVNKNIFYIFKCMYICKSGSYSLFAWTIVVLLSIRGFRDALLLNNMPWMRKKLNKIVERQKKNN